MLAVPLAPAGQLAAGPPEGVVDLHVANPLLVVVRGWPRTLFLPHTPVEADGTADAMTKTQADPDILLIVAIFERPVEGGDTELEARRRRHFPAKTGPNLSARVAARNVVRILLARVKDAGGEFVGRSQTLREAQAAKRFLEGGVDVGVLLLDTIRIALGQIAPIV